MGYYHTHPEPDGSLIPSDADLEVATFANIPGIIIGARGLFQSFGPLRRGAAPDEAVDPVGKWEGFPGNTVDNRQNSKCSN